MLAANAKSFTTNANFLFARSLSIRQANATDKTFVTDSILELVKVGENLTKSPRIDGLGDTFDRMINDTKHYAIYVAEDTEKNVKLGAAVVSFHDALHMGGKYAYLEELVMSPSARGIGLGSKLLTHVEKEAKAKGMFAIGLSQPPSTSQYNEERSKFYVKNGYSNQSVSRVKFFKPFFKVD